MTGVARCGRCNVIGWLAAGRDAVVAVSARAGRHRAVIERSRQPRTGGVAAVA